MKVASILLLVLLICSALHAEDDNAFESWIYPKSKYKEKSLSPTTITSADKTKVRKIYSGHGQFISNDPFHEVLAFYVRKSGLKPPNWSILGREFPGTEIYIPAHFSRTNFYREHPSVTLQHYIQENVATAHLLVTDHPQVGFVSVTITRGREDDSTLIQMIQHPSGPIGRNVKFTESEEK